MQFTNNWFRDEYRPVWEEFINLVQPKKILEVGCYEGRATCFLIEKCPNASITCVDTWEGAADLSPEMMSGVEQRFDKNTCEALQLSGSVHLTKCKMKSTKALPIFLSEGRRFDFIYIDGSHTAPDVLSDAVDAFRLLREGGILIFDDYTWHMEEPGKQDSLNMPKPAIDAFVNLYQRKLKILHLWSQLTLMKTHD